MVSEKYITQLVGDIKAAHKTKIIDQDRIDDDRKLVSDDNEDDLSKHFEEVENYLSFDYDNEPSFGSMVGLEVVQFPEVSLLPNDQANQLYTAFIEMLASYNVSLDIPETLPIPKAYTCAITILNEAIFMPDDGHVTWDLCSTDSTDCIYSEYCHCIELDREFEENLEYARQLLIDIKEGCDEVYEQYGPSQLVINEHATDDIGMMCMFVSSGVELVPFEIYQQADFLEDACASINRLFPDADINEAFQRINEFKVHWSLAAFLSLQVSKYDVGNCFYVEPYYVDDGTLKKGIARQYTPEELIAEIESAPDTFDDPDYADHNDELPF